ncbi:MAG TPA: AMP-binding protein [Caulobacteraceae bacterium]|jgi:long-chain acyl-CoA synthetase|nr:AMP-binding protein [Caulobacteraceae bacterium]
MNIAALIERASHGHADAVAISWIDEAVCTYRELMARAGALAAALRRAGLRPGDRVMMAMSNSPRYYEVLLGCWFAGLVAAPQNCRLHPAEVAWASADCGATLGFATPDLAEALRLQDPVGLNFIDVESAEFAAMADGEPQAVEPREPADPALLFYTSGTTGKPKGAILSHRALCAMSVSFLADSGAVVDDHILHLAPMSHASGFLGLSYLLRGRNQVVLPTGRLDAESLRRALLAFGPLSLFAVPTVVRRLMDPALLELALIPKIHTLFFGGAPMYGEDLKRARSVFGAGRLWHLYGQGESPNTITHLPPRLAPSADDPGFEARLASVGIPRSGVLVRLVRPDGAAAAVGELGEVAVQGDTVMSGYWNQPEATAEALRGGWLHTGDLGRFDERGYLTLVDRSKDVIISGGSNIYPREIEEVLLGHPQVAECAVIGIPDEQWGETPFAFVVATKAAPSDAELDALCLGQLARYKRPKGYRLLPELPKSAYGKVLKTQLRSLVHPSVTSPQTAERT